VGNSDLSTEGISGLSTEGDSSPRRGLVIFPADASAPRSPDRSQAKTASARSDWWLVFAAIALGAVVIAVALIVR
jgi:hypothetical protein